MSINSTISKIEQAVQVGVTLKHSWFRGHSKQFGKLVPKVFREEFKHFHHMKGLEFSLTYEFKRVAPSLQSVVPENKDSQNWLFLMQHHGAPTRLLDWTQSILVALFFTVSNDIEEDGEIWALYPPALNNLSGISSLPTLDNIKLKYLFAEPSYINNEEELLKELSLEEKPKYPIALLPPLKFSRMNFQQSAFTIHPKPKKDNKLTQLLNDEKSLICYRIPRESKKEMLYALRSLGISNHTLFPDLDALSAHLINEFCTVMSAKPPKPLEF